MNIFLKKVENYRQQLSLQDHEKSRFSDSEEAGTVENTKFDPESFQLIKFDSKDGQKGIKLITSDKFENSKEKPSYIDEEKLQ